MQPTSGGNNWKDLLTSATPSSLGLCPASVNTESCSSGHTWCRFIDEKTPRLITIPRSWSCYSSAEAGAVAGSPSYCAPLAGGTRGWETWCVQISAAPRARAAAGSVCRPVSPSAVAWCGDACAPRWGAARGRCWASSLLSSGPAAWWGCVGVTVPLSGLEVASLLGTAWNNPRWGAGAR